MSALGNSLKAKMFLDEYTHFLLPTQTSNVSFSVLVLIVEERAVMRLRASADWLAVPDAVGVFSLFFRVSLLVSNLETFSQTPSKVQKVGDERHRGFGCPR